MNTKGIKFLAVLAVLAMAFAVFAVLTNVETDDAADPEPTYVAQIGDTKYETLAAAVAAGDDETIKILTDIILDATIEIGDGSNITIDLNGKKISKDDTPFLITHGQLTFTGTGTVYESITDGHGAVVLVGSKTVGDENYSVLTVGENVTLKGWAGVFVRDNSKFGCGVVVNLNGKAVSPGVSDHKPGEAGLGHGVYVNGNIKESTENVPIINVGSKAEITAVETGIYNAGYSNIVIADGAKVTSEKTSAIETRAGTMTINGGTFSSGCDKTTFTPNGNGPTSTGVALAVIQHTTVKDLSVTINGGTFTAKTPLAIKDVHENDTVNVAVKINGGTFVNSNGGTTEILLDDWSATVESGKTLTINGKMSIAAGAEFNVLGTVVNNGTITNKGTITVSTASPVVGMTGITGAGTIVNEKVLKFTTSQAEIIKQPCTNTIKTMNGGSILANDFEMIAPSTSLAENYGIKFTDAVATEYILSTFNGVSGTTYTSTTWPGWTYSIYADASIDTFQLVKGDVVNIMDSMKVSVGKAITIPDGAFVNVMNLAILDMGENKVTNNGTIDMKEGAVVAGSMVEGSKPIKTNGKEIEQESAATTAKIEEYISKAAKDGKDVVINVTADSDAVEATVKSNDVTLVGNGANLTNIDITVEGTATSSKALTISGFGTVSGKITTKDGSSTQSVMLSGFTGTIKVMKGSIIIDGVDYGGTITVDAGTELKLSGTVKSDLTINYNDPEDTEVAAKVIIESGKGLILKNATKMIINNDKISLQVDGTISLDTGAAASIWSCGDITINNGGVVEVTSIIDQNSTATASQITITVNSGATLEGAISFTKTTEGEESKLIAYSGSDINGVTTTKAEFFVGKDAEGGEWTVKKLTDAPTYELILRSYSGTYNFYGFEDKITKLTINGENKITYAFSAEYEDAAAITFFGKGNTITAITTDETGSLDIQVDISKVSKDQLFTKGLVIIALGDAGAGKKIINGVDISINVSGTNATWTDVETAAMKITGIDATKTVKGFNTYNADITMDIVSAYKAANVFGITVNKEGVNSADVVIDNAISIDIKTAGTGIKTVGSATFSNSASVVLDGKKNGGLNADGTIIQSVISMEVKTKAKTGALTVMASNVKIAGSGDVGVFEETNSSIVTFTGTPKFTNTVDVKMNSTLNIKNAIIDGKVTNDGTLNVTGDVVVYAEKEIQNNSIMTNSGLIGVYGKFTNKGAFNNTGTIEIYKYGFVTNEDEDFIIGNDKAPASAGNVRVVSITLLADVDDPKTINTTFKADGTAKVNATVTFKPNFGPDFTVPFSGILTPGIDGSYTLALDNGTTDEAATATITLKYVIAKPVDTKIGGTQYTLSVTGTVKNGDDVFYIATNDAAATMNTDEIVYGGKIKASGASIVTDENSVIVNEGKFIISSGAPNIKGIFTGDLVTNTDDTTISGIIKGNVTANGEGTFTIVKDAAVVGDITTNADVVVDKDGGIAGNVTTEKGVNATGGIIGNITAKNSVTVTDLLGSITVNANGPKNVTVKGVMLGDIIYVSKYKATPDAKAGEETEYTAKMHVDGEANGDGFTIILAAGSDATSSAAVVPGFFKINNTMVELETGKIVELTLTEGKFYVDSAIVMKTGYYLNIEAGTTIEVNKSAASLDVTSAALKVSNEATSNFETGSATPVNYGKVLYIMAFETSSGYKMYSDVAYALSNCDEGSELTLGVSSAINTNVDVPAGVNIIVDSVTLSFNGMDVKMGEGAKITLLGNGQLVFKKSGDNTLTVKEDEDYEFYSVTACIVYGDNELDLEGVRFSADGNTIIGKAATESATAKIDVDLKYNEGTAMISEGAAIGDLKLANIEYYPTKAAEKAKELKKTAGSFVVAENAFFELESFTDAKMDAKITDGEVEILKNPTVLTVMGVLEVCTSINVGGVVYADGSIILDDDKTITIEYGKFLDDEKKSYCGPIFTGVVFDKLDNGFALQAVVAEPESATTGAAFSFKADKTNQCIAFSGFMYNGSIEAVSDSSVAMLHILTIYEGTTLEAAEAIISGANTINGLFKNVEMTKRTDATLKYNVTYIDGVYNVYTIFKNIDFDEVSDITLTETLEVSKMTDKAKLDLSGKDVNITIADKKKIIVDKVMIIGTPISVLGDEGSSITGTVEIADKYYLVAYADVDLSEAEIIDDLGNDAVFSKLDVEDVLYAVIFAVDQDGARTVLAKADAALIPEIVGYTFTAWLNYNGDAGANVGDTNAYAGVKATYVFVTVKYVEGVDYYMDGSLFNVYNIPTEVPFGSYFTAKISDTTKYQGNPLINGEKTVCVIDDMELVASGVTPIPEPPAPEPVVGDSGLSLTDILLIVLVILIAIMVVILVLRLNRS